MVVKRLKNIPHAFCKIGRLSPAFALAFLPEFSYVSLQGVLLLFDSFLSLFVFFRKLFVF